MNIALPRLLSTAPVEMVPRVLAVWEALEARYLQKITVDEVDHLLALYVLGLTTPIYGRGNAAQHLSACRELVAAALPRERVEPALHTVPVPSEPWVATAFASVEQLGIKDGAALLAARSLVPEINNAKREPSSSGGQEGIQS